jgi:uncharacterized membrane protein
MQGDGEMSPDGGDICGDRVVTGSPDTPVESSAILPAHIEQTVQAIARLHAAHHRRATPLQRIIDRMTAVVAHPSFLAAVTLTVLAWIAGNLLLARFAGWSLDKGAFPWLQGAGELAAIYITALILMSQRRKDELSELREQLTLELAIMTEQKGAKIVSLIEEMRRDNPLIVNRDDAQAEAMSTPADPEAVFKAIKDNQAGPVGAVEGAGSSGELVE